jgi:hypothetical protein
MCIIHKGFRGFRAMSPASILGGSLLSIKSAIPYEIIHKPLAVIDEEICLHINVNSLGCLSRKEIGV